MIHIIQGFSKGRNETPEIVGSLGNGEEPMTFQFKVDCDKYQDSIQDLKRISDFTRKALDDKTAIISRIIVDDEKILVPPEFYMKKFGGVEWWYTILKEWRYVNMRNSRKQTKVKLSK